MNTVAVCLATYNGEKYLVDQIDSILFQLGINDTLLVADDGSTDSSISILKNYGDKLTLVYSSRVGGVVPNIERLLEYAAGLNYDFIVLADQDDVWLEGRIDLIKNLLSESSLTMMNAEVVDANLSPMGCDIFDYVKFHHGLLRNFISTKYVGCCMAFRRKMLDVILPFPSKILWHDWYIALVALLLYECSISSAKTLLFRRHISNLSNTGKKSKRNLMGHIYIRFWMIRALFIATIRFYKLQLKRLLV